GEVAAIPLIVEGLDPESIARAEQLALLSVPDREAEHSIETLDTGVAVAAIGREDDLGVAAAAETRALALELGAQLDVVVDLPVVGDPAVTLGVAHRLM